MNTYGPSPFFGFVYRKSGGYVGYNLTISYESITKKLTLVVGRRDRKIEKQLEAQDEDKLKQTFSDNEFFEVGYFYHESRMCDDIYYTLIATIDGQIQASHWADFSMGLGERKVGLSKIASAIEQMARR